MTSIAAQRNVPTEAEVKLWDFSETITPRLPSKVIYEFMQTTTRIKNGLSVSTEEPSVFGSSLPWNFTDDRTILAAVHESSILGQNAFVFFRLNKVFNDATISEGTVKAISERCKKVFDLAFNGQWQKVKNKSTDHLKGILHFSYVFEDAPWMTFHMIPALERKDGMQLLLGVNYSLMEYVYFDSRFLVGFNEVMKFFLVIIFQWNSTHPSSCILPQAVESILLQCADDWMKISFQFICKSALNIFKRAVKHGVLFHRNSWNLIGHLTQKARDELLEWLEKLPTETEELLQFAKNGWRVFCNETHCHVSTIFTTVKTIGTSLDKTGPWKRLNVYLVGDSGAGKTSVTRWLLGQDFDPSPSNTDSAEVVTTRNWNEDTFDIKEMIAESLVRPSFQKTTVALTEIQNEQQIDNNNNSTGFVATESIIASPNQNIPVLSTQTEDGPRHQDSWILDDIEQYKAKLLLNELPMTFCIWDFGGQEVYHNTHHLFLTQTAIYILVVDLSIEDICLQSVFFWLQSIRAHSKTAPIMIVGTHSDMISEQECNSKLGSIFETAQSISHPPSYRDMIAISCKNIKTQNQTRRHLQDIAEMLAADIICPLRWMLFYHALETKSTAKGNHNQIGKITCLPIEQAYEAASSCGMTQDEMNKALSLCHECGFMLYYKDNKSLNSVIFMNPPQLVAVLRAVVTVAKETPEGHFSFGPSTREDVNPASEEEIKVIISEGRFTNDLLERLFQNNDPHLLFQLRSLLEQFGLALPDPKQHDRPSNERDLIVPCLVQKKLIRHGHHRARTARVLLTEVPLGLSSRLIAEVLKLSQKQEYEIFLGGCIFTFEDVTFKLAVSTAKVNIQMQRTTNQDRLLQALQKLLQHFEDFFQHFRVKYTMQLTCFVCHDKRIDVTHSNLNAICPSCRLKNSVEPSELMELQKRLHELEEQFKELSREHVKVSSQLQEEKEALMKEKVRIEKDLPESNLQVEKLRKDATKSQSKSMLRKQPLKSTTLGGALWKRLEEKITSYQQPRFFSEEQSHLAELIHTCDMNLSGLPSIEQCQKFLHPHAEGFGEAPDGPIFLLVLNNHHTGVEYHANDFVLVSNESSEILRDLIDDIYQAVHLTVIGSPRFSHKTKAGGFCFKLPGNDMVIFPALKHTDGTNIILDKEHDEVIYKTASDITVTIIGKLLLFDRNQACSIREQLCYGAMDEIITNRNGETTAKQVKSVFHSLAILSVSSVRIWALSITELTDENLLTRVFSIWNDFHKTLSSSGPNDAEDSLDTLIIDPKVIMCDRTQIFLRLTQHNGFSSQDKLEVIFYRYNLVQQQAFDTIAKAPVTFDSYLDMTAYVHTSAPIAHPMERALAVLVRSDHVIAKTTNCWFQGRHGNELPVKKVSNESQQQRQSAENSYSGQNINPATIMGSFWSFGKNHKDERNPDNNDDEQQQPPPHKAVQKSQPTEKKKTLHDAAFQGELQVVMEYIHADPTCVDKLDTAHNTPLHRAVQGERLIVMDYLISKGAKTNLKNIRGCTPLEEAGQHHLRQTHWLLSLCTNASPEQHAFWPTTLSYGLHYVITVISKTPLKEPACYMGNTSLTHFQSFHHVLYIHLQAYGPTQLTVKPDKHQPDISLEITLQIQRNVHWSRPLLPSYDENAQWRRQKCTAAERELWQYAAQVVEHQTQQSTALTLWIKKLESITTNYFKKTELEELCQMPTVPKFSAFCVFEYAHKIPVSLNENAPVSEHLGRTLTERQIAYLSGVCADAIGEAAKKFKWQKENQIQQFTVWPPHTYMCNIRPLLKAGDGSYFKVINPSKQPKLEECQSASFLQHVPELQLGLHGIHDMIGLCKLMLRSFTQQPNRNKARIPSLTIEIVAYSLLYDWIDKHPEEAPFFAVFRAIWKKLLSHVQEGHIEIPIFTETPMKEEFVMCDELPRWIENIINCPKDKLLAFLQEQLVNLVSDPSNHHNADVQILSFELHEHEEAVDQQGQKLKKQDSPSTPILVVLAAMMVLLALMTAVQS